MGKSSLDIINLLYHNKFFARLFHTSVYCLRRELRGCRSVLDLGCGPDSPLRFCDVPCSVGVDAFEPYVRASKLRNIHTAYIIANISDLDLAPKSFDAVIMIDVLEHLTQQEGEAMLEKAERWARQRIIVTTPNGFLPQGSMSDNPYQVHRSGWAVDAMRSRGYRAYGMAGLRLLRHWNTAAVMEDPESIFCTLRWRPKLLWLGISEMTQLFTYYFPRWSFEVFYVRDVA